jgi:tripartite ATP-independent transporter DctM subunit
MEWYWVIALITGGLLTFMMLGLPVAFSFLLVTLIGAYLLFGGMSGVEQLVVNIVDSLSTFTLVPVALFMIMGEAMFQSRIAVDLMDTIDKWFGKLRGRLAFMAVGGGVLFSTLTGNSMGSNALLGSSLVPEMEKRGYKKPMSLGPILGSAGLAIMIPPSSLAVVLGVVAELSIGKILIAIILPGLLMAVLYTAYILIRCTIEPDVAPSFDVEPVPLSEKLSATAVNIVPLGVIIFSVVGVIFMGIATPSEAAATGAVATLLLAAAKRRLTWEAFSKSMFGSANISVMLLMIVSGAVAFTQILAFTGATEGMVQTIVNLPISSGSVVLVMITTVVFLGMFMGPIPIMLVTLPIFVPVVIQFGYDPSWFAAMYLVAIETGSTSPPLGGALLVMKAVAPKGTTMNDIYKAATPFIICDVLAIVILYLFPQLVTWPVSIMS